MTGKQNKIYKFLDSEQQERISEAVACAEGKTQGEIVPVIVASSTPRPPMFFFWALSVLIFLSFFYFSFYFENHFEKTLFLETLGLVILVSLITAWFLDRFCSWGIFLWPSHAQGAFVFRRAQLEFFLNRVHNTQGATGILIFVSILERKAVILGDAAISARISQDTWNGLLVGMTESLKKGQWEEGFVKTIGACGEILSTHFPIGEADRNELSNKLVIKD